MLEPFPRKAQPAAVVPRGKATSPNSNATRSCLPAELLGIFFGAQNRGLHIPGFLQSPEIAPSCLGADTRLCLRLNFPNSSQKLFKLPGEGGHDAAAAKDIPADTKEPKTFAEVIKDREPSFWRCCKLQIDLILKTKGRKQDTFFFSLSPTFSDLQMQLYRCENC